MGKLPLNVFKVVVENTPLIAIDLIVEKNGLFLLGKRINEPAKGFYFVPGGRIFKGEKIKDAFKRITKEEIRREINIEYANFLGIYEHFYENSFVDEHISTHYIVLAYKVKIKNDLNLPLSQHENYIWLTKEEIIKNKAIHPYSKAYFRG